MIYKLVILILVILYTSQKQQTKCRKLLNEVKQAEQSTIKILAQQLEKTNDQCIIDLIPRYYWGQNMTHIMVLFQFLSSTDTSICTHKIFQNKTVGYEGFYLSILCAQTDLILRYRLSVTTFKGLNFHYHSWRSQTQNTLILECLKTPIPYFWNILHSRTIAPLRKPKIWWKIYEKNWNAMQNYMGHLQFDLEQNDIIISAAKKKRKISKQIDIYYYCGQGNPYHIGSWL